ncbi:MAG: hypothetical protein U0163_19980 [Gemmatimonadaceae bacterium]
MVLYLTWSPDGQWLAYVTWNDLEGGDIYRVRADGSTKPERLTRQKAFYEKLVWAPDGRVDSLQLGDLQRIEFFDELRTGRPQSRELIWIPCRGGRCHRDHSGEYRRAMVLDALRLPHFTTDTTRIWFTDAQDGLTSAWDGSERRSVLRVNGWEWTRNPPALADEMLPRRRAITCWRWSTIRCGCWTCRRQVSGCL